MTRFLRTAECLYNVYPMPTQAAQHVRRMRGGAQAHLMRASDGHFYVVKFQNNPQHLRVLANEFLATRLAERVGLPVPVAEIVEVSPWLVQNTPALCIEIGSSSMPCAAGLQFGARYVCDPGEGVVFDYLPESMMTRIKNPAAFAGMLVLDKWLGNANGRQAVFSKKGAERKYTATFIESGKRASLLALSPLRTGRESFPSSGSSRS